MSQILAELADGKKMTREKLLALRPPKVYDDGRTKQAFRDETDIQKIMGRADIAGTISHLEKFQGVYADFSDFDFHEQTERLTQGRMIFDALPAEVRDEFRQDPQAFFNYVNDPINAAKPGYGLPHLAKPGTQIKATATPDADTEAKIKASDEPAASIKKEPEPISARATSTGSETVRAPDGA